MSGVRADLPVSQFPPARVADRGRDWYRGDCHVHSVSSKGGELTPAQLVAGARAAGLDFAVTTEHNTAETHGSWRQHIGADLLVVLGQEVATPTRLWLALGVRPGQVVEWRYGMRDNVVDAVRWPVQVSGGVRKRGRHQVHAGPPWSVTRR